MDMSLDAIHRECETYDLKFYLPNLLNQASEVIGNEFQNICKKQYGLLRTDWTVLLHLGTLGRMSAKEICERSNTHKTKISRSVSRLEDRDFLTRERSEQDRRWEFLELTTTGKTLFNDLQIHAAAYEDKVLSRLTSAEGKTLRETLQKLMSSGSQR